MKFTFYFKNGDYNSKFLHFKKSSIKKDKRLMLKLSLWHLVYFFRLVLENK